MEQIRLVDRKSVNQEIFESRLKLKPVVIAVSVAMGMAGTLVGCHDDDHKGGGSTGAPGTHTINTSGGAASSGYGGNGDEIVMYAGALDTIIEILTSDAGAPSMATIPETDFFGDNRWDVSADTTLEVVVAEPAAGTPYQVADDCNVYVSDGNETPADEPPVTGIDIQSGATLTLEDNKSDTDGPAGCLELDNDLNNDGGIASDGDGSQVWLNVGSYFGTGTIDTAGVAEGANGGNIYLYAAGSIYNSGDMTSQGADSISGDAGNSGYIELYANGTNLWNSGVLNSSGGNSMAGYGGTGGEIDLSLDSTEAGSIISAGTLYSDGGSGTSGGGDSDYPWLDASGADNTHIYVTASMYARGGDASGAGAYAGDGGAAYLYNTSIGGETVLFGFNNLTTTGGAGAYGGGDGGDIELYSDGEEILGLINQALIDTRGGDATATSGTNTAGNGGAFLMWNYDDTDEIDNSGAVDTSGGSAASGYGGDGGYIEFYRDGGAGDISNTGTLTALGGDGTDGGGDGGNVELYADGSGADGLGGEVATVSNTAAINTTGGDATTGSAGSGGDVLLEQDSGAGNVSNTAPITTLGGNSDSGYGGDGGDIEVEIEDGDGSATNSGVLLASGGNSDSGYGGSGGTVEVEQESSDELGGTTAAAGSSSRNTGTITTNGGTGAYGGDGGDIDFYSPGLPSSNTAQISAQGGDGTQDGGDGGDMIYSWGEPFTNSGNIDVSGGNGNGTAGYGGDGGDVTMYSTGDTSTSNTGSINQAAGTGGSENGTDGILTIDGAVQ